ncbi:MAG: CoA transferase, partial [Parahaliea sp.]
IAWAAESGAIDQDIAAWDWVTLPERLKNDELTEDDLDRARAQVAVFLRQFSKAQIIDLAIERKLLLAPVMTTEDLVRSPHHAGRNFYRQLARDGKGAVTLPGDFAMNVPAAFVPLRPAPALGEGNRDFADGWPGGERPVPVPAAPAAAPLAGIKVLDLAWVVAGPLIGRALADFGATVVRVESSRRIETARMMGPFPGGKVDPERSALYDTCNAGKFGLALDLASEEGRAVVRDLVRWADVVVESFSPGQMARWGLGYDQLRDLNPSLIMLSTSLMGQSGPYTSYAGFGNVGASVSGYQAIVGHPDGVPVGPFGPYTDFVGPRFGLVALLAALEQRRRSGEGGWLDVSQAEAGVQLLAPYIAKYSIDGEIIELRGNRDPQLAPNAVFACLSDSGAQAWIAISVRDDSDWRKLAQCLGVAALDQDERFATLAGRKAHEDELEQLLDEALSGREALALERALQALGLPAHRVVSSQDMAGDEHLAARGYFVRMPRDGGGACVVESARYLLSDTPARVERSAPGFGRDKLHVLKTLLNYSDGRIEALDAAGVLA